MIQNIYPYIRDGGYPIELELNSNVKTTKELTGDEGELELLKDEAFSLETRIVSGRYNPKQLSRYIELKKIIGGK